ncbi:Concanavalin A-like lectin family protein [Raphanus sativus]|uniref:L-type lectin-domain containing receptor kinase VIII.1 n=1 Tax=Raphanus sativus TaxID=3726 RepID=A0A6J0P7H9_RAPSA|nr:L-type lectin-domain containing receptor kinase VIII.1 [Raphanus sativus]KAJ4893190.1 Concanavalin A-like lectin family protein [Raphanus sativus]
MSMFKALSFLFVMLCFKIHGTMATDGNSSFWFDGFAKSPSFYKNVALFGDSKLVSDISSIQLTNSVSGSVGRVVYRKPIKLFQGRERNLLSFSSHFSFSMPNEVGDVMAFVMVPTSLDPSLFGKKGNSSSALEFLFQYAKKETVVGFEFDISNRGNLARILIGRPESSETRNLSFEGDLVMTDNGGTLSCMVEYEALSKRMMVRFRKSGSIKLLDPFFSFSVDLGELWSNGEFVVGLSSANGNSSKVHFLHSWSFEIRHSPPVWTSSLPLEPNQALEADVSTEEEEGVERSECIWRMLGVLVLGAVCGALGVLLALYLWIICGLRRSMAVVPEECHVKRMSVAVDAVEEGKK